MRDIEILFCEILEKNNLGQILKVKRLSDSEVFEVGDSIIYPLVHAKDKCPINSFRVVYNEYLKGYEVLINQHENSFDFLSIIQWIKV